MSDSDFDLTPLAAIYLVYSLYALILSLLVCISLVYRYQSIWKSSTGIWFFFLFFFEFIGCIAVIICCIYYLKEKQVFSSNYPRVCNGLGFILLVCELFKNFIIFVICLFSYIEICTEKNYFTYKKLVLSILTIIILIIASIPFMVVNEPFSYGNKIECWINEPKIALSIYYIPIIAIFIISIILLYFSNKRFVNDRSLKKKNLMRLFVFPSILMFSYIFSIFRVIFEWNGDEIPQVYLYFQYIFLPLHSILSALYYCYLKKSIFKSFKKCLFPQRNYDHYEDTLASYDSANINDQFD